MKKPGILFLNLIRRVATSIIFTLGCWPALAATFTTNTDIAATNMAYDGMDIIITNCTVTVDGPHSFNSLHVETGGVLTHSFVASGVVSNVLVVTNESHVLTGTNAVALLNSNVILSSVMVSDTTGTNFYTEGADYLLNVTNGLTDLERTTNSSIASGESVLVDYDSLLEFYVEGLFLTVTNNVQVDAGGAINANGIGYGGGLGTGAGHTSPSSFPDGSGGGYGGNGGTSSSNAVGGVTYGTFYTPTNLGSGGGSSYAGTGGPGGGIIEITAGGAVTVNGSVSANGATATNSRAGGGAGGSIFISGQTLSGTGSVTANGGAGEGTHGGGGGGGRISLQYGASGFVGAISAYGGAGATVGGAGTIYTVAAGQNGLLLIDNGGQAGANTALTVFDLTVSLQIQGKAVVVPSSAMKVDNLTVASNGTLLSGSTELSLTSDGAIVVQAGGSINANNAGSGGEGVGRSGTTANYPCGGGGYGGDGGNSAQGIASGGISYGDEAAPNGFGSAGGSYDTYSVGGGGGGWIQITSLSGIIQVNGTITANGGNGSGSGGGGGSGGTVVIFGGTLLGSGSITANGGAGANTNGGGGGGGRLEIDPATNLFTGVISACGGGGANYGGAGAVVIQSGSQNQIICDNGGNLGTNTPVFTASGFDLIVQNGAVVSANGSAIFANLYLNSNGWLVPLPNSQLPESSINLTFTGSATIATSGGIVADFDGYSSASGSGPGRSGYFNSIYYGSGAGHGGYGGSSYAGAAFGGSTYDSPTSPSQAGSGGGAEIPQSTGGPGGGIIRLSVTGNLNVQGIVTANGGNGLGLAGGGGSGGSIWVTVGGTFQGAGAIAVNGGSGVSGEGGGGAGGMIYVSCANDAFAGQMTAYGGNGANWGGMGTAITQVSGVHAQLVLDNNGNSGTPSPLPSSSTTDVTLRNGAVGLAATSLSLGNLVIGSNASLLISNISSQVTLTLASANIEAGGGIIGDSYGYPSGEGPGAGRIGGSEPNTASSGAGHGGYGASSYGNLVTGGVAYDTETAPADPGSGGGANYDNESPGGAGGAAVNLNVSGLLQVDGIISVNGGNGSGPGGGGGSGGSIRLSSGTFAGAGTVRANGGSGATIYGGGGAGGIIAISPTSNLFTGAISACGGSGASWGGAGSVYIAPSGQSPQFIIDNCGQSGAVTPISLISSSTAVTLRNGGVGIVISSGAFGALLVSSNSWLLASNTSSAVALSVSSATIQAGGGIIGDSNGYAANAGTGSGHSSGSSPDYQCSGAGHGGLGGNSISNTEAGGTAYDNQTSPTLPGSGGGGNSADSFGGAGGACLALTASGLLQVDGIISANGGNGYGLGGGGGAGGGIYLSAATFSGAGIIRANGGSGAGTYGGGGGGGIIAINPKANSFTGTISAYGGGGANWGGAGTIYVLSNGLAQQFIIDNGGQSGAATPIQSVSSAAALTLRNGAVGYESLSLQNFASLLIGSNAFLVATNIVSGGINMTLSGSATVQAGGGIVADSAGYIFEEGPGAGGFVDSGNNNRCTGGGYGGNGGGIVGITAVGGLANGSVTAPFSSGSGGGGQSEGTLGGSGGGIVKLTVGGALDVDGRISANGGNGSPNGGGGGAGGSIWLVPGTFAGSGTITANGGAGVTVSNGGGGGGRIAVTYNADSFTGVMTAYGGSGDLSAGAGTIYMKANSQSVGQVLIDNGGATGAGTPLSASLGEPSSPYNLTIQNGGEVAGSGPARSLLLNNLTIGSGGALTAATNQTTLDLLVFDNLTIASGGAIIVDGEGYPQGGGTGAGQSAEADGSGAGYGGVGGASATVPGGTSYGSASQPAAFGSGGGFGGGPLSGGSAGGGALRLNVGGILTVNGQISAAGLPGLQDDSGGGSGGSIWVTAGTLTGSGQVVAPGGEGNPDNGGGGAGGRIALYSHTDIFSGQASALGGEGYLNGAAGTVVNSNNVPPLQVLSNSPTGIVSNAVSSVTLYFNGAPNPNSVTAGIIITAPNGPVSPSLVSMSTSSSYLVSFPQQTAVGTYTVSVNTNVTDMYGGPLGQAYAGTFVISLPVIQGTITDTNGNPIPGVLIQSTAGFSPTTTDTNGTYALGFVPGTPFTVTPSLGALMFAPPSITYTNATNTIINQNYFAVTTTAATLSAVSNPTNVIISWQGLPGVTYQILSSPDLINWTPYGSPMIGSNAPVQVAVPQVMNPQQYFEVQSGN